jgi:predicted nucleotidyltransferase
MKTSHPINSVIPTVDGLVLEVLAGTTGPLNLVSIQSLARDASVSGVRKALLRLVSTGVVEQVPGGYALNRDHLAAPAVLALAGLRSELMARIARATSTWEPQPALVGIFGSAARREGDDDSDIDILVVTEGSTGPDQAGGLAQQVQRWTGNPCHIVTASKKDLRRLRRQREPILSSWDRDLVVIAGDRAVLKAVS